MAAKTLVHRLLLGLMLAAPALEAAEPSRLSELFYQLQVMQQELNELRGLVEEQAYAIRKLEQAQTEQYRNLDRRLLEQQNAAAAAATPPATSTASAAVAPEAAAAVAAAAAPATPAVALSEEQQAYNDAYALIGERRYDDALRSFNRLIVDFPAGELTGNALYWLGELYLVKDETERARAQFIQVLDLYPDHRKIPDTLFKLGVTYARLGDRGRALEYLNQVRAEYPQHEVAEKAADYAREM
ncbi:MAG: tol-pal system protein YbgF [Pseudomonadota bacterium]